MVWSIEYRGIDEEGGGLPGTYLDIAQALQKLSDDAARLNIDFPEWSWSGIRLARNSRCGPRRAEGLQWTVRFIRPIRSICQQ